VTEATEAMGKIRVGMIRCDLHGMYYAALMAGHDPIALRDDRCGRGHAAYFYFYTYYNNPTRIMVPTVGGFQIARVWDQNPDLARNMQRIWHDRPSLCRTFEEVSDDVDLVFIADCNGDGSDHMELAAPGLKKGVPTFVDKPLAYDVKDAQSIIHLAEEHDVPVASASMLGQLPHVARFRKRFSELGAPEFGTVKGGGAAMAGQVHAISLAQHLFGFGVESVECMGPTSLAHVLLDYGGKPDRPSAGVVLHCASGGSPFCAMYAGAFSRLGAIHSPAFGDFEFPWGAANILRKVKRMVRTGRPAFPYEQMP